MRKDDDSNDDDEILKTMIFKSTWLCHGVSQITGSISPSFSAQSSAVTSTVSRFATDFWEQYKFSRKSLGFNDWF